MFGRDDLDHLLQAMRRSGVTSLKIEGQGQNLTLALPATAPVAAPAKPRPALPALSPDIGQFRPRGQDDGLSAITAGDPVSAGEVLGYVATGAVLAAILAPGDGRICAPIPETGAICGYGDVLFTLEVTP